MPVETKTYDYIIAGAGSAGCVLANRLSASGASVLLLEAGHPDNHPFVRVPAAFTKLSGPRVNWGYSTVPQKHVGGREIWFPQGKTIGGSSSINAMIYTRGTKQDYDGWARGGADGWSYADVLPYFRKSERNLRLADQFHGTDGPLAVSDPIMPLGITANFIRASQEAGIPYNADFNGARQSGVGYHQTTTDRGRRASAAACYLRPALARPNLTVVSRSQVLRVLIKGGRAAGVEFFADRRGGRRQAWASQEVLVTCGALGSPKLLMLSGVGPAEHLRQHGIPVVHDSPGVGSNLQDHLGVGVISYCSGSHSYSGGGQHLRQALWAAQYLMLKSGPATTNLVEAGAFTTVDPAASAPDTQLHFMPLIVLNNGRTQVRRHGVSLFCNQLRPSSRGTLHLASADPAAHPLLDPNYLGEPDDLRLTLGGLRLTREIMAQPAFRDVIEVEAWPGRGQTTDAELTRYVHETATTDHHPVGTCKIGRDPMAVVDPDLRVYGIERLRVCDAAVMPDQISGNTNAPTIMIAEKAADLILGAAGVRSREASGP